MRMPAEWERQEAIWLAWPHNKNDWPGKFEPIKWVYAEIIKNLVSDVRVRLIVKNMKALGNISETLTLAGIDLTKIDFIIAPTNRSWLRDSAPTFVYQGKKRVALDWKFNAWAKYDNWKYDDKIPTLATNFLKIPTVQPLHKNKRVVLEGGAIEVNGKGTLITTEECLLDAKTQVRNPGFKAKDYEEIFAKYLGVSNTIWLEKGIEGDDTHGHIDDLARFVNPTTIVTVTEKDKSQHNHTILQNNLKRLKAARDQNGKQFTIVELPMPRPIIFEDQLLPASYANFLIANDVVLVPTFNDPNDRIALNILSECFPKHDVIGIYSGDFILGLGTIHCASQQEIA